MVNGALGLYENEKKNAWLKHTLEEDAGTTFTKAAEIGTKKSYWRTFYDRRCCHYRWFFFIRYCTRGVY